jgi:glutamine phosphoribosylpyrophosphate amidotransferase
MVLRISMGENGAFEERAAHVVERVQTSARVRESSTTAEYLRLVVDDHQDARQLEQLVESAGDGIEVVSMGRRLEIVKQVGSPENLDATYGVSGFTGTHGIGHTRLSTESRIDLSHSQPFWAHGYPDLAIVHNGHITNYHKMRRRFEQHGVRFYTHNDSEIIGVYLAHRLSQGMTLEEAFGASLADLDGSFSYLAATPDAVGFVRDPFALKPLLFTETDTFVAVATEEIAIRAAFEGTYRVDEAQAKDVRIWQR